VIRQVALCSMFWFNTVCWKLAQRRAANGSAFYFYAVRLSVCLSQSHACIEWKQLNISSLLYSSCAQLLVSRFCWNEEITQSLCIRSGRFYQPPCILSVLLLLSYVYRLYMITYKKLSYRWQTGIARFVSDRWQTAQCRFVKLLRYCRTFFVRIRRQEVHQRPQCDSVLIYLQ